MFPNNSKLNMPGTQAINSNLNGPMISNNFIAPNLPTPEPTDFVRSFLFAILIIFITLALILFGYSFVLSAGIQTSINQVKAYDKNKSLINFQNDFVNIRELSQRLKLLEGIYNKHLYVSQVLLPILESLTESDNKTSYVYFNKFFVRQDTQINAISVSLSGVALDYETLIRQIDNFKKPDYDKFISNFKLNSLSLNEAGQVLFDISFNANFAGDKLREYIELVSKGDLLLATSTVSLKSGPLFKQTAPAKNVIPVEVQAIYDSLEATSTSASIKTVAPVVKTGNLLEDVDEEITDDEES